MNGAFCVSGQKQNLTADDTDSTLIKTGKTLVAQPPRLCFYAGAHIWGLPSLVLFDRAIPSAGDPGSPDRAGFARAGVAKRGICSAAVRISRIPLPLVMLSEHERPRGRVETSRECLDIKMLIQRVLTKHPVTPSRVPFFGRDLLSLHSR